MTKKQKLSLLYKLQDKVRKKMMENKASQEEIRLFKQWNREICHLAIRKKTND